MVRLTRIYTRTGDGGETGLGDGTRVRKTDPRIVAYGTVDEVNAAVGLLLAHGHAEAERPLLETVQHDLFDVGADLCVPASAGETEGARLRVAPAQVERLERAIDRLNAGLPALDSFVLPGGAPGAAWCHHARVVCRRAEREVVALAERAPVNPTVVAYLNRLSDLLFVLGRVLNDGGARDVLWRPGKGRSGG